MNQVVVTFSDAAQWHRAKRTIEDIRGPGRWWGPLVFMAAGFEPPSDFIDLYEVTVRTTTRISTDALERKLDERPFTNGDGRERSKTIQWTKLRLFENWITEYERVFYVDAGFRVFKDIQPVFDTLQSGRLLALDDAYPFICDRGEPTQDAEQTQFARAPRGCICKQCGNGAFYSVQCKTFGCQLEPKSNPAALEALLGRFPDALASDYFINYAFAFDTSIVGSYTFAELLDIMHTYPIFRTNEMGAMNVYFHLDRGVWQKLPTSGASLPTPSTPSEPSSLGAPSIIPLWDWTERDHRTFRDYLGLKYPRTVRE